MSWKLSNKSISVSYLYPSFFLLIIRKSKKNFISLDMSPPKLSQCAVSDRKNLQTCHNISNIVQLEIIFNKIPTQISTIVLDFTTSNNDNITFSICLTEKIVKNINLWYSLKIIQDHKFSWSLFLSIPLSTSTCRNNIELLKPVTSSSLKLIKSGFNQKKNILQLHFITNFVPHLMRIPILVTTKEANGRVTCWR